MDLYDITYILALLAAIMSLIAQGRVRGAYNKYKNKKNKRGLTGAEAARLLMLAAGVSEPKIVEDGAPLTDHYDPATETLCLSKEVYHGDNVSAVGIAAHEAGHALQHAEGYTPLYARQSFVKVANIGSRFSIPVVLIGVLLISIETGGGLGNFLISAGLLMFSVVVALTLITLPVEFNASRRAVAMLDSQGILESGELVDVEKILSAAAWTYVASAVSAVLTLLRLVLMSKGSKRR